MPYNKNNIGANFQRNFTPNRYNNKKRSGARFGTSEGGYWVNGWKIQNGQMITFYAREYSKSKTTKSQNNKEWVNLFVTITNKTTFQTKNCSALLDINKKRLYIKELGLIATANGYGGYFGPGGYKMRVNK